MWLTPLARLSSSASVSGSPCSRWSRRIACLTLMPCCAAVRSTLTASATMPCLRGLPTLRRGAACAAVFRSKASACRRASLQRWRNVLSRTAFSNQAARMSTAACGPPPSVHASCLISRWRRSSRSSLASVALNGMACRVFAGVVVRVMPEYMHRTCRPKTKKSGRARWRRRPRCPSWWGPSPPGAVELGPGRSRWSSGERECFQRLPGVIVLQMPVVLLDHPYARAGQLGDREQVEPFRHQLCDEGMAQRVRHRRAG
jgi:hypothetical protein